MNIKRGISAGVAGLGALAASNELLRRRAEPLEPPLSGSQETFQWHDTAVRYVTAGNPSSQTVVLLHGLNAAGSSGEFRQILDQLAEKYHVVAPDLPGFGMSDRPKLRYSAAYYESFVEAFLKQYADPVVIASSLTTGFTAEALQTVSSSEFIAICPTDTTAPQQRTVVRELLYAPLIGRALFNLLTAKFAIRYFNADHGYYDTENVSESWIEYEWQTAHQPNARFAPASFISGFLNSDVSLKQSLIDIDVPTTLIWGRDAELTPLSNGRELAEATGSRLVVFDAAKLLPHVEFPEKFIQAIDEALR